MLRVWKIHELQTHCKGSTSISFAISPKSNDFFWRYLSFRSTMKPHQKGLRVSASPKTEHTTVSIIEFAPGFHHSVNLLRLSMFYLILCFPSRTLGIMFKLVCYFSLELGVLNCFKLFLIRFWRTLQFHSSNRPSSNVNDVIWKLLRIPMVS